MCICRVNEVRELWISFIAQCIHPASGNIAFRPFAMHAIPNTPMQCHVFFFFSLPSTKSIDWVGRLRIFQHESQPLRLRCKTLTKANVQRAAAKEWIYIMLATDTWHFFPLRLFLLLRGHWNGLGHRQMQSQGERKQDVRREGNGRHMGYTMHSLWCRQIFYAIWSDRRDQRMSANSITITTQPTATSIAEIHSIRIKHVSYWLFFLPVHLMSHSSETFFSCVVSLSSICLAR